MWAPDRARAVERMRRALTEYVVTGIRTNLAFHEKLFAHPEFVAGRYDTGFIERYKDALMGYASPSPELEVPLAAALAIAGSRLERSAGKLESAAEERGARLSPWVARHRAKLRA
mgnify:CR=1 FL=1